MASTYHHQRQPKDLFDQSTHFESAGGTLKSRSKVKCCPGRRCKRKECEECLLFRRTFFVEAGEAYVTTHRLDRHVILTWPLSNLEDPWSKLARNSGKFAKMLSGLRAGPYIRFLAVGTTRSLPHIHCLVPSSTVKVIERVAGKLRTLPVKVIPVTKPSGLLGYLYDRNFLVSLRDPERPRRIRLICASRGMPCGFPGARQWKALHRLKMGMGQ